jgi:aryl-alcohol dehydrogenase-like predicted oxidoreductase
VPGSLKALLNTAIPKALMIGAQLHQHFVTARNGVVSVLARYSRRSMKRLQEVISAGNLSIPAAFMEAIHSTISEANECPTFCLA